MEDKYAAVGVAEDNWEDIRYMQYNKEWSEYFPYPLYVYALFTEIMPVNAGSLSKTNAAIALKHMTHMYY